jgi:UDP-glucose 6-dehydrogenase
MAELGHRGVGVHVDDAKIATPRMARCGPSSRAFLSRYLKPVAKGALSDSTASMQEAVEFGDIHFIYVDTPQSPASTQRI